MKKLKKKDLKEGEIYKQLGFNYIFLYNKNKTSNRFNDGTAIGTTSLRYCKKWSGNGFKADMIEATPEEKHWLETCIKADKFVSYEEAIRTFIPEYVECVSPQHWKRTIQENNGNLIFKSNFKSNQLVQIIEVLPHSTSFKPSTKEAYDAQFVVKEPEFVLPEIWWVRITQENLKDVSEFLDFKFYERAIGNIAGMLKHYRTGEIKKGWNGKPTTDYGSTFGNEITTEQFRKYVLKKENVVLEEPKDKVLQVNQLRGKGTTIVQVQCSEGGIYKIGDKITVFDKTSSNKGKPFTVEGFRWSKDKSKICAITELHTPNGIGLDKIELYVEPKFVLPEKWCVKVTSHNNEFINSVRDRSCTPHTYITSKLIIPNIKNSWLAKMDAPAEGFTEITFEQFKKYVLNEKV